MKTVLHFIGSLEVGGTENMLLAYLRNTKNKELRHIVCTIYPRGPLREEFRKAGIELISLGIGSKIFYPLSFPKFFFLLRKIKPDIVHSYLLQENLVARIACKLSGRKLICGKRDTDRYKSFWKVWLDRLTLPLGDLNISNSKAGIRELKSYGIPEKKLLFIPNGKDVSIFVKGIPKKEAKANIGFSEKDFLLGCISRLYKFKGQEYAIHAMPAILKENGNARLVLVGEGEAKESLSKLISELGLRGKVILLGERKDIPKLLQAFDIFVFPSLREGMPGAVMEAMAAGLPVVATDIDGNRELIEDGKNGLLVPPEDGKAISSAVLRLLKDEKMRERMGKNAKEKIERVYSIEKMVESLDRAYEDF